MTRASLRRGLALVLAVTSTAAGAWIRLTPWNSFTHVLSVGSAELSPGLIATSLFALSLALPDMRSRWASRIAGLVAIAGVVLPLQVMRSLAPTRLAFDRAFTEGLGVAPSAVDPTTLDHLRPDPFVLRDAFRRPSQTAPRVTRGVPFVTHDGVTLTLDVYRPRLDRHGPIVVQWYGGGWRAGVPGDNEPIARALADAGAVVLAVDYRHAPAWTWPAQFDDARAALAWSLAHGREFGGDPARIVLIGRSAGAQLALLTGLTAAPGPVRGIVAIYSPVDLTSGYREPPVPDILDARALEAAFMNGTPDTKPQAYKDASPISYADQPHPPVLLINGTRDYVIRPAFGQLLHRHLKQSGISVYLELPWAGHGFDAVPFGPNGQLALYYTERFIGWAARDDRER